MKLYQSDLYYSLDSLAVGSLAFAEKCVSDKNV